MLLYIARLWQWERGHAKEESRVWGGGRFGHLIPTVAIESAGGR